MYNNNTRSLQVIQPNGTFAVGTRNYYNYEYPLLKKWLEGGKLTSTEQHKIANLTTYNIYNKLYRGTVVSKRDFNEGEKDYKISGLQSWTTNNTAAKNYANESSNNSSNKVKVIFMANANSTRKVKTYNVQGKGKGNFSNRNTEIIVNRPIFRADFYAATPLENGIYSVPVEFIKSHKDQIVNKKTTTTLNYLKKLLNNLKKKYEKITTV